VVFGSPAKLGGTARGVARVMLELRPYGGQWKVLAPLSPKGGQVGATVAPKVSTAYRLSAGPIHSGAVQLSVAPLVRIFVSADRLSVTGLARPVLSGSSVQIQKLGQNGWITLARTTTGADGDFAADVQITSGSYRARVVPGRGFVPGVSRVLKVGA
jgi:hypothetical protein